ncbi:MAG: asparagine synthetase B family protein [Dehalococcoidia bacterium]
MSGIAAIYDQSGAPVPPGQISPLLAAIAHRGAFESVWQGPAVALGARTVSAAFDQAPDEPWMRVAPDHCRVVLDGHIDSRDDVAAALGLAMEQAPIDDAALIALAYARWGVDALQRLIGDFAFVLWDGSTRRLFAARDQRGFRPLVYARVGRRLILGSEPRQLLVWPDLARTVDALFLACHLTGAVPPSGVTPYAGVSEIPPAHYLLATEREIVVREYWRFEQRPLLRYRRSEDYVEHFTATFHQAVADAVRGDPRPGVLLSGGLDSSYVLAKAVAVAPNVRAYTAFAEGVPGMDERRYSRSVGERLGVAVQDVAVDDCWSLSSRYLHDAAFDQPAQPMQAPLMIRMAQAARQDGVRVLLDGMGGDEGMAGSSHYLSELLIGGHWLHAVTDAREWARREDVPLSRALTRGALKPLLPTGLRTRYRALRGRQPPDPLPPWIERGVLREAGLQAALALHPAPSAWRRGDHDRRFWAIHQRDTLPVVDWRERNAGLPLDVEARSPFWDLRVIELLLRFPPWVHRDGGRTKAVLRAAMRPLLPTEVVERDDKGVYDGLMNAGLLEHETERVRTALRGPLASLPYVRGSGLELELETYRGRRHLWWQPLWRAVTAGLWLHAEQVSRGHTVDRLIRS